MGKTEKRFKWPQSTTSEIFRPIQKGIWKTFTEFHYCHRKPGLFFNSRSISFGIIMMFTSQYRLKNCIYNLPRRLPLSTAGWKMPRKIWQTLSGAPLWTRSKSCGKLTPSSRALWSRPGPISSSWVHWTGRSSHIMFPATRKDRENANVDGINTQVIHYNLCFVKQVYLVYSWGIGWELAKFTKT